MSLYFQSSGPRQLLADFKRAIDNKHVTTWSYDADGDFTHTPGQWAKQAWMRPSVGSDCLTFNILSPQGKALTWETYAVFHGRLAESITAHLHDKFTTATGTSKPTSGDNVGA